MKQYTFTSNVVDWYFSRYFSVFHELKEGIEFKYSVPGKDKDKTRKTLNLFYSMTIASIFIFIIGPDLLAILLFLFSLGTLFYRFIFLDTKGQLEEYAQYFRHPETDEVDYIMIDEQGLYVNNMNNKDMLAFTPWSSINSITFSYTEHYFVKRSTLSDIAERDTKEYFDKVGKVVPQIMKIEQKVKYNDRYSLTLSHNYPQSSHLAIPQEWLMNGEFKRFVEKIKEVSGIEVEPPSELGIYFLDGINRVFDQLMEESNQN